jgi:deoxyadenosine/deoxycytidine kinase
MGKLISVVGVSGVGKTTLVKALIKQVPFRVALEDHLHRSFQKGFKEDPSLAFHNQIDFLLHKAEQEAEIRKSSLNGLVDGGLDLDFHVYCKLFRLKGWLSAEEFSLLERFYKLIRSYQPMPELIIHVIAQAEVVTNRLMNRKRINIASDDDIQPMENLLITWLSAIDPEKIVNVDSSQEDEKFSLNMPNILGRIRDIRV